MSQGPQIVGLDERDDVDVDVELDLDRLVALAASVLVEEGIADGELGLTLVSEDTMAELHVTHMDEPGPTDVLSFPLDAHEATGPEPVLLGDIVICPAVAARNAAEHAATIEAELELLVVHGVLHVLGHDHAEPDEELAMQAAERRHLEAFRRRSGPDRD